jgi:hypothetical protein
VLFGEKLGTDVSEEIDETFTSGSDTGVLFEILEFNEVLDLNCIKCKRHAT